MPRVEKPERPPRATAGYWGTLHGGTGMAVNAGDRGVGRRRTAARFRVWKLLAWTLTVLPAVAGMRPTASLAAGGAPAGREPPPSWAYPVDQDGAPSKGGTEEANDAPKRVPGSEASFTAAQIGDLFNVPDWHPAAHPAMPHVVRQGRAPEVFACGYCHLPNGLGRPENSSLAGLSVDYILEQMADFRNGLRKSSEPRAKPTAFMIAYETKATEEETRTAAEYFSGLKPRRWIRVVETKTVPETRVSGWMLIPTGAPRREPIGQRIVEMPEDLERTELRDDRSGFVAYAPVGSLREGKALVTRGGSGRTVPCALCHGSDLRGFGKAPALAGRSPSYLVRQLYDFQSGARAGSGSQLMTAVVVKLTLADMVSIAAYTASLRP